jgi:N6-adenosine-specific RNA methylase IME4
VATLPKQEQAEIVAKGEKEILEAAKRIRLQKAEVRRMEIQAVSAREVVIPDGKFGTIVIDPPWPMEKIERDVAPNQVAFDYPTMTEQELAAFPVPAIAADNCHLFCWTTHKFLPMSLRLLDAWGFRYVLTMVWHKPGGFQPFGLPQYNCEFAVYARRGAPTFADTKAFNVCFQAPRREHSRKPDEFYDVIRRVTAGPRIDVFSRENRDGFDVYGNEAGKFAGAAE